MFLLVLAIDVANVALGFTNELLEFFVLAALDIHATELFTERLDRECCFETQAAITATAQKDITTLIRNISPKVVRTEQISAKLFLKLVSCRKINLMQACEPLD